MEKRLNKYISELGYCSRRKADKLIEEGKVTVDGIVASIGTKVTKGQQVVVEGTTLVDDNDFVYIALYKPRGITSTTDKSDKSNIVDFVNHPKRIFHIGRLDKDSEGLILMTNDGDIVNKILRTENNHEKEYIVRTDKEVTEDFVTKMSEGVPILGTVTKPCDVKKIGKFYFKIVLTEGLNRQIRRMCHYFGYRVFSLKRIRIMNIKLDLEEGKWRYLTEEEFIELQKLLTNSKK